MAEDKLYERFGREFPAGHVLFRDGEPGKEMYVIQAGKVRISKSVRGVETTLVVVGPGAFFGEMSILNNKPRSASATVEENSKLLVIDPKTFEAMVRGNAEIAVRLIKTLAQRLQEADDQIENLLFADASSRVVHWLVTAAEKAERGPTGHKIALAPRELPGRVGVRPDQADEVLMKLLKANIISVLPDGFVVPDVEKLKHFLEFLQMKAQFGDAT